MLDCLVSFLIPSMGWLDNVGRKVLVWTEVWWRDLSSQEAWETVEGKTIWENDTELACNSQNLVCCYWNRTGHGRKKSCWYGNQKYHDKASHCWAQPFFLPDIQLSLDLTSWVIKSLALQGVRSERKKLADSRKIGMDVSGCGNRNSERKGSRPE